MHNKIELFFQCGSFFWVGVGSILSYLSYNKQNKNRNENIENDKNIRSYNLMTRWNSGDLLIQREWFKKTKLLIKMNKYKFEKDIENHAKNEINMAIFIDFSDQILFSINNNLIDSDSLNCIIPELVGILKTYKEFSFFLKGVDDFNNLENFKKAYERKIIFLEKINNERKT